MYAQITNKFLWIGFVLILGCSGSDSTPTVPYASRFTRIATTDKGCEYTFVWGASEDGKTAADKLTYSIYVAKTDDRAAAPGAWEKVQDIVGSTTAEGVAIPVTAASPVFAYITAKNEGGKESLPSSPVKLKPCVVLTEEEKNKRATAARIKAEQDAKDKLGQDAPTTTKPPVTQGQGDKPPVGTAPTGGVTLGPDGKPINPLPGSTLPPGQKVPGSEIGTTINTCPAPNAVGTKDYKVFGLQDSTWSTSSAVVRFDPSDEPVYTLPRDPNAPADQCTLVGIGENPSAFVPRAEIETVNKFCTPTPDGRIPARNVYVGKPFNPMKPGLFLTKTEFNFQEQGPTLTFQFVVNATEGDEPFRKGLIDSAKEVRDHFNEIAKQLVILPAEGDKKFLDIKKLTGAALYAGEIPLTDSEIEVTDGTSSTAVKKKVVVSNLNTLSDPAASPPVIAPFNDYIRACNTDRIVVANFSALKASIPQFKYGLTVLQFHPNQERYPGFIIDSDILIDIAAIIKDTASLDEASKLFKRTLARQLLFALGADGNHSTTNKSLLSSELQTGSLGSLDWQFTDKSYEASVLLYLYGSVFPNKVPEVLKQEWDSLVRDVPK